MNEIIKQVKEITDNILKKEFKQLKDLEIPKKQGVYIIKEKSNRFFNNQIFYVGKSINLFKRIFRQHNSERDNLSTSVLRRKLHKKGLESHETSKYLKEECLFIIQIIENYDINSVVEDLLIATLREKGKPLINEIK